MNEAKNWQIGTADPCSSLIRPTRESKFCEKFQFCISLLQKEVITSKSFAAGNSISIQNNPLAEEISGNFSRIQHLPSTPPNQPQSSFPVVSSTRTQAQPQTQIIFDIFPGNVWRQAVEELRDQKLTQLLLKLVQPILKSWFINILSWRAEK